MGRLIPIKRSATITTTMGEDGSWALAAVLARRFM
jgi:hypothetical protein